MTEPTTSPEDSALRPAESDLHPADPTDDLTGNTPAGADTAASRGSDDLPDDALPDTAPDAAPDTAPDATPDTALPGDTVPGDGSVAHDRPDEPDAMRTAEHGRESAAAHADLADDRPTPTATPAD